MRSIVSFQSRYDDGRAQAASADEDFDNFTIQENRGKALFMRNCTGCHMKDGNEHFFVPSPSNNGLSETTRLADGGVGDVTLHEKLPQPKNDLAMALVKNPVVAQSTDLYVRLRNVLDREEYENFQAAARRTGLVLVPGRMPPALLPDPSTAASRSPVEGVTVR